MASKRRDQVQAEEGGVGGWSGGGALLRRRVKGYDSDVMEEGGEVEDWT